MGVLRIIDLTYLLSSLGQQQRDIQLHAKILMTGGLRVYWLGQRCRLLAYVFVRLSCWSW